MQHDFSVASREANLVLYDPGGIPDDFPFDPDTETGEPKPPPETSVQQLADTGNAFIVTIPVGDCEATLRVLIDEPHQPNIDGQSIIGAHLAVPTGVLTADGVEFIHNKPNAREHGNRDHITIEPGIYELDAFEQFEWKEKHRDAYVKSRTRPIARRLANYIDVFTVSWVVLFVSSILFIPAGIIALWAYVGSTAAIIAVVCFIAVHAVYLAIFRILDRVRGRWPEIDQPYKAHQDFERDHPDIVAVMRLATTAAINQQAQCGRMTIRW